MRQKLTEPKIVNFTEDRFDRELVPGVAHMKHTFGNNVSVALFKVAKGKGSSFPDKPHAHGEEVALQIKGSSKVFVHGKEYVINQGEMIIMPEGLEHSGIFTDDEESWLVAIATPPRDDYGEANWPEKKQPA